MTDVTKPGYGKIENTKIDTNIDDAGTATKTINDNRIKNINAKVDIVIIKEKQIHNNNEIYYANK